VTSDIVVNNDEISMTINGSIYVEEAASIREQLVAYLDNGHKNFIINLGNVDYIDSSGLGVLVGVQKRAIKNGGSVRIRNIKGVVKELFELTRLTKVFEIE
jgi:anti-sigma B factor antagonist